MSREFLDQSVDELIEKLDLNEKISLLAGVDWWNTVKIDRFNIPSVRMSDGPNGVRGSSQFLSTPTQCIPSATSLAATFDTELIGKVGAFLAEEAKTKSSTTLLAPTCNIQRNPLGGRAFESFSEDPHLSGSIAAAYVNGLQSNGVGAAIKHFVCNDQEHERLSADSVVSDRALREIYLYPFMLAQRDARPWAYMTSYGRMQGTHCSEKPELLRGILRGEWKFDGLVMSDCLLASRMCRFGTYSVDTALNAGLDLEMPGPTKWRAPPLVSHQLFVKKITHATIDERARSLLNFVQKLARVSPDVVYGDGEERTRDTPESRAFNRRVAAEGMVLLKNSNNVLPLSSARKIAVIGPNAKGRVISGGGSAHLKANYIVSPWNGIVEGAPEGVQITHAIGCYAHKSLPALDDKMTTESGQPGWDCTFHNQDTEGNVADKVIAHYVLKSTDAVFCDSLPADITPNWTVRFKGILKVDRTAPFEFGLTVAGQAKLWINDELKLFSYTKLKPGEIFYEQRSEEEKTTINLTANEPVRISVEYSNTLPPDSDGKRSRPAFIGVLRLGGCEIINSDQAIQDAASLAKESDAAVLVVGLTHEWESESYDRTTLALPGRQDELIKQVAAANPNTVVVLQSGSAISMPWLGSVAGLVQAWYSGNEVGNAIADVLFGKVNPSGKMPLSFPKRIEDIPAYPNLRAENGKIHYREDLFVGYKHYQAKGIEPLIPFGFGLSYTTFRYSDLKITSTAQDAGDASAFGVEVSVTVTNTGNVEGSEAVQLYIGLPESEVTHPKLQLKAFAKARNLAPGASKTLKLQLNKYAVSFWDVDNSHWLAEKGTYRVVVGSSSVDFKFEDKFTLGKSFTWSGL
ncbi:glycoside hydrolase family 3 protein [Botryobasidium botryosum FD-172 SS1]|uniref:beta-glucosidase n=1 Tax=Botryobasidium botryosum (strain FD-172 SS1) TaxID=930990 RepID=A0A067MZ63_BOTB1|nr:glycoside hydrolase family 3 protein [Botryobasidium botryosum FD-172 SS1]